MLTGLWPLVHLRTFEALTGKKIDDWLVQIVGALITVIGVQLWFADPLEAVGNLGLGAAASLAALEAWFSLRGRISRIYLVDVPPQLLFIGAWLVVLW